MLVFCVSSSRRHELVVVISDLTHLPLDLILVILYDFSLTVKAAPHECVIRTGQS